MSGGALGKEQSELRMEGRWCGGEGMEQGMKMGRDQDAERGFGGQGAVGGLVIGEGEEEVGWLGDEAGGGEQVAGACGGVMGQGPEHDAPKRGVELDQLHKLSAGHGGCLPPGVTTLDQVPCL